MNLSECIFLLLQAQFRMCYDAVRSVLESFDEYSNFNGADNE